LLKTDGLFSFIVPHTWTSLESFTTIRNYILDNTIVKQLVQLPKKVFADATVETCIFLFSKETKTIESPISVYKIDTDKNISFVREFPRNEILSAHLQNFQLYGHSNSQNILEKIKSSGKALDDFVKLVYGFKTGDDDKFISPEQKMADYKPFVRSADIYRYGTKTPDEFVWYVPELMIKHRQTARPGELKRFLSEKIIVARMGKDLIASYDSGGLFVKDAMLLLSKGTLSLKYILSVLNSRLMNYYYHEYFITIDVLKNALLSLPIPALDLSQKSDKDQHDRLVALVEQMLALKQKEQAETLPQTKTMIGRQIQALDRQIDGVVYGLYNLTEDEIMVVEGEK
jgi:hypothetical protein